MLTIAATILGKIVLIGGGTIFDEAFMDLEISAAIALIDTDKGESSKYAGILILRELARNSPLHFQTHMDLVLDKIGMPLRDPRVLVREAAAEALGACLKIMRERIQSPVLLKIQQDAHHGLKSSSKPEVIHGCLLTYRELLRSGEKVRNSIFP